MDTPDSFLSYWDSVRGRTMRVAACIPAGEMEWRPADHRWSFGDTLRHLGGIERDMYAETVHGRPSAYQGHGSELAEGTNAVIAYLNRCHVESMELFRALTPDQWDGKTTTAAGTAITTWKWLRAMVEHEAHHRGQIYLMLGMMGVSAPPLYGLTEEDVAARSARR
jgi:uncharacterized damage-inducible protein DinB